MYWENIVNDIALNWKESKQFKCHRYYPWKWSFLSYLQMDFPGGWDGKESAHNVGDLVLIPVSERRRGEE